MAVHIALLRAVNVGGHKRVAMPDLRSLVTGLGFGSVQTLLQSGNVVFKAGASLATRIPPLIASGIEERFGYRVPVLVRTLDELRDAVRANPFLGTVDDTKSLHVAFLAETP